MRDAVKTVARGLALIVVLPALLTYAVKRAFLGSDRALEGSSEALSLVPGVTGQYMRRAFLAIALDRCAPTATIGHGTTFSKSGARIDDRAYIGPGGHVGLAHIERDVLIGSGVEITSGRQTHGTADAGTPIRDQEGSPTMVRIGAGAWIGSGAIVMADVGANSVVGAGAVVTSPVPPSTVSAGVPAQVIRQRT